MSLENIVKSILDEAELSAKKVLKDAEKVADDILKNAEKDATVIEEDLLSKAQKEALKIKEKAVSKITMKHKNAFLKMKVDLINEIIFKAKERICNLKAEDYFEKILKLCKLCFSKGGKAIILFSKNDSLKLTDDLKEKVRNIAKERGIDLEFSDEFLKDKSGGFVIKYGDVEENCTLDSVFLEKKEELVCMLNSLLFN